MPGRRIDFPALARQLLDAAERLVPQWLTGGNKIGHEWQCGNLAGEPGKSCSVNLTTGQWADFATGEKGGDLISLYAAIHGVKSGDAAKRLIEELRLDNVTAGETKSPGRETKGPKAETKRAAWTPIVPVPDTAGPAPVAHPVRGKSQRQWTYRDREGRLLGQVHRFETSDGDKEILPVVWARNAAGREDWRWMQWAMPRPLYGLDRLRDDKPVLIVEGEKCADVAHEQLGESMDCLAWPGGGNAARKVDWSPLAGRRVVLWPDCDAKTPKNDPTTLLPEDKQPGVKAMEDVGAQLLELGCEVRTVRIPAPGEKPDGWDIADAVADGATRDDLLAMLTNLRPCAASAPAADPEPPKASRATSAAAGGPGEPDDDEWQRGLLRRRGELVPCVSNIVKILTRDPSWIGVVGYDEFASRTVRLAPLPRCHDVRLPDPHSTEWTDVDTSYLAVWLTNVYGMTPGGGTVDEAIELVARVNAFHPVRQYLRGLAWDGERRIDSWLTDYLCAERNEYTKIVGRRFLIAMVARAMRPGVKFDYCLVLEGQQGLRKSTALRVLAGEWFSDTELDLANKDALSAIRGKWLHEFSEMGSIARIESQRQKSFLSRTIDEFRPVYGRREIRCPRQLVFAGSTNEWQWNKDSTGGRRFWPIEVGDEILTDALAEVRDQLFAEAVAEYDRGARFWPTADEQRRLFDPVQLQREAEDAFMDPIHDWLEGLLRAEFTLAEVLTEALKLDAGRMTRDVMTRVGMLLKKLGCTRVERRNGVSRFVYVLPAWTRFQQAQQTRAQVGDRDGQPLPL